MSEDGQVDTNADGGAPATFADSLGEGLRGNEAFKGFENVDGLASAYLETNQKFTEIQGKVPVIPEKPEAYNLSVPEGYVADGLDNFKAFAHEHGLTEAQANKLLEFDNSRMQQAYKAQEQAETQAVESLKTEWGVNFKKNVTLAQRAVEKIGGPDLKKFLDESRLGNNPQLVKMFHKIGESISEDSLFTGGGNNVTERPTMPDGSPMLRFPSMERR